ncbi:MAG: TRAP transporter fused permease subunit, partial [Burkholderiaceae bacterium]
MSANNPASTPASASDPMSLDEFAEIDSGGRNPAGLAAMIIAGIAFIWSCFQLYIASGIPFWMSENLGFNLVFNNQEARQIHLAFAIAMACLAYPLLKKSPKTHIPLYDWVLLGLGVFSCLYLFFFKDDIAGRAGLPTIADLAISSIGMVSLALAVYRSLGLPMLVVASFFVFYVFFGHYEFLPDVVQWKGASFGKAMWHFWMQSEGVFGVALGVSATMIYLFVLFGALLEKAGAGNYFIQLALALLGHLRGGPAKAAVVASGMSGLYSGSSIANVVTTGTFTIPLMRKTGFSAEKAGAVEVASSTNGQLTPPVMGAAAFLIAEFTGITYTDIIRHAIVPALVSYIALFYIVHLEAMKLNLVGIARPEQTKTLATKMLGFLTGFIGVAILGGLVYYGLGTVARLFPDMTLWAGSGVFLV